MRKDVGQIYKHGQYQHSTLSLKTPVSSSPESQTSSGIELPTTSILSVTDKHQNNYVLYSQIPIKNNATITNNDNIHSCETPKLKHFIIATILTNNHHSQSIASRSSSRINFNTSMILP